MAPALVSDPFRFALLYHARSSDLHEMHNLPAELLCFRARASAQELRSLEPVCDEDCPVPGTLLPRGRPLPLHKCSRPTTLFRGLDLVPCIFWRLLVPI